MVEDSSSEQMLKIKRKYKTFFLLMYVIADFSTHGGSHLYGLPYPYANSLDPMDHFCTFYVSNIIPKNTQ